MQTFSIKQLHFSPNFANRFIMLFLLLNSVIGSMALGELRKGKSVYGLRYLPALIIVSFKVFFIVRTLIRYMTGRIY